MQILVTGGAGFIGSHLAEHLLTRGHQVRVVDDLSAGSVANLPDGVSFHQASILEPTLTGLCHGCDVVVHAAAQTSVAASSQDPATDGLTNIIGTLRTLMAAKQCGARRLIYLSSAAVYGSSAQPPITEAQPPDPTSPYGLSKWAGERYVRLVATAAGMEWVILRLANVYGPRQSSIGEAGVVARWSAALAEGRPIPLFGDGGQTRDFIYVGDVAEAVAQAAEAAGAPGQILHVSTGQAVSLQGLIGHLETISGLRAAVHHEPPRPGDIYHSALDPGAAWRALGWKASTTLKEGLALTWEWARLR